MYKLLAPRPEPKITRSVDFLLEEMEHYSRMNYCAGWATGLEYDLWDADGTHNYEVYYVHWLAQQVGGWWELDNYYKNRFVPMKEWIEEFGEPAWWAQFKEEQ